MKLTAAPIVRQPIDVIGAPGKTDFVRIYIGSELNKDEFRTTLRHEQAHVWAGHNRRRPDDARPDLWQIACEMEIARTIYDDRDIANITAPRSRLAGGYLPRSINGLPEHMVLAEQIYEWLLDQPENELSLRGKCCACQLGDAEESEASGLIASPEEAREQLDSDEASRESQLAASAAYSLARDRPPSLTGAVDAALRVRVEREKSYRRPSRGREHEDVILAGAISTPRPPLVEIFIDRSGSFTPDKTAAAELQLGKLLSRYGATIRADVWFFGDGKLVSDDPGGGGNTPYDLVARHISLTSPKLAIVITDDDPVDPSITRINKTTTVLCVPIGCVQTSLAHALGGRDVVTR